MDDVLAFLTAKIRTYENRNGIRLRRKRSTDAADGESESKEAVAEESPSSVEKREAPLEEETADKRFMRFGKSDPNAAMEEEEKRFMRFGREPAKRFMRFGRGGDEENMDKRFMRFGRAGEDKRFMRFGREPEAEKRFMRFGRDPEAEKRFMRFGRGGDELGKMRADLFQNQPILLYRRKDTNNKGCTTLNTAKNIQVYDSSRKLFLMF